MKRIIKSNRDAIHAIRELEHVRAMVPEMGGTELRVYYRFAPADRKEATAYYTTDPQDAYDTALHMNANPHWQMMKRRSA